MAESGLLVPGLTNLPRTFAGTRIQTPDVALGGLTSRHMNFRHLYIAPTQQPMAQLKGATGAVPSGATGATNILHFTSPTGTLEQHIKGAGQTLIVPTIASDGLEISGDQTSTEGMELYCGLTARSQGVFVIGTDPAFFLRARLVIDDVSGATTFFIGFTINSARQTAIASYTDYAGLNLNAGQWESTTRLNSGSVTTTTLTGSTVADLGAFEVFVYVSATGVVTYGVGTAGSTSTPALAPAFTLDTGDIVTGSLFLLNAADLTDSVRLRQLEVGFQTNYLTT